MVNVLEKALGIVEAVAASTPVPMTPARLAAELNLNRATCSRLLKQLLEAGYVTKVSRQRGYAAGPKLFTLNHAARFEEELLKTASPVVDRCAEELQCSVLLAWMHYRRRYVLHHRNCSPVLNIRINRPCYNDLFGTATGLVLIAHSPYEEQLACLREQKAAGRRILAGFESEEDLKERLRAAAGPDGFHCETAHQWIYAFPVFRDGRFCAALGGSFAREEYTPARHRAVCRTLKNAAREISDGLTPQYIIG